MYQAAFVQQYLSVTMTVTHFLHNLEDFPLRHLERSMRGDDDVKKGAACKRRGEGKKKLNDFCELLPTHSDLADDGLFTSGHFRR